MPSARRRRRRSGGGDRRPVSASGVGVAETNATFRPSSSGATGASFPPSAVWTAAAEERESPFPPRPRRESMHIGAPPSVRAAPASSRNPSPSGKEEGGEAAAARRGRIGSDDGGGIYLLLHPPSRRRRGSRRRTHYDPAPSGVRCRRGSLPRGGVDDPCGGVPRRISAEARSRSVRRSGRLLFPRGRAERLPFVPPPPAPSDSDSDDADEGAEHADRHPRGPVGGKWKEED